MSRGLLISFAQCLFAIAVLCLFLWPAPAAASSSVSADGLTLTLNSTTTTMTEGGTLVLDYTASNGSGSDVNSGATSISFGATTGDTTDVFSSVSPVIGSPCVELAPVNGGSCDLTLTLTSLSGLGETDGDSGVTPLTVTWETSGPPACPSTIGPFCVLTLTTNITVLDPTVSTPAPEPSSLLLVGSGLLGFGPWLRCRVWRA
jgi:PEP-CTERM motif